MLAVHFACSECFWECESLEILRAEVEALWSYKRMSVQLFQVSDPTALGVK